MYMHIYTYIYIYGNDKSIPLRLNNLEEVESEDGDGEEPVYVAEDGTSSLVPPELLGSVPELLTDEPALRDSHLNVDDDLTSSKLSEQETNDTTGSRETGEQVVTCTTG